MQGKLQTANCEENMRKLLKIPLTTEQFFQVFEKYNQTIFPMQIVLILVAIASVAPEYFILEARNQ